MQLQIQYEDPRTLVPADYNPREWPAENRARLLAGLRQFGFVEPVIVRPSDRLVIGGHFRLDIALEYRDEFPRVPVIFRECSDEEAKALNILLNNPDAQGRFNLEMLADIFDDLDENMRLATGFDSGYIDNLLEQTREQWSAAQVPESEAFNALPNGERAPFEQMTFNVHDLQAARIREAVELAKQMGEFDTTLNTNSNGNALTRICDFYIMQHANSERFAGQAN